MSIPRFVGHLAVTVALCVMTAISPAEAQGLFQSLFGISTPAPRPVQRQTVPPPPLPYRQTFTPPAPESRAKSHEQSGQSEQGSGSYRTLCVRMCDGYYWPINQTSARANFHREAKLCQASCGSEAKLFYHPNSSPDVDAMIDLTGRAYTRLPNAFRFRKTLVGGCQCKPAPWTESELDRHRHYAALEASAKPKLPPVPNGNAGIEVVAGATTAKPQPAAAAAASSAAKPEAEPAEPAPEAANPSTTPEPSEKAQRPAATVAAASIRLKPVSQIKPDRQRSAKASAAPVVQAAAKSKSPAASGAFGLGGGGLKWPGE